MGVLDEIVKSNRTPVLFIGSGISKRYLYKYPSFEELYKHFDKVSMGYKEDEIASFKDMEKYYSKEEQEKYGVVGIKIKKLDIF